MDEQMVAVGGRALQVSSVGSGPVTLVILSGSNILFPGLEYAPLADALREWYSVLIPSKFGYGFSDRSSATENVIFYDGRAHKLQEVVFMIGQDDKGNFNYMDPWTISSSDGRFEGIFEPILDRKAKIDMKVIASDQHQVFGHLTGTAVLDDGSELKMRDVIAAIEVVHNRY